MLRLLLAMLLVGTLPSALPARDAAPQTEKCATFKSDASSMPPEARQALKRILVACSANIAGSQCKQAIGTFEFEYGDRFTAIDRGVRTWSLLEQRSSIRRQLYSNYRNDPHLDELKECLQNAYRAGD